MLFSPEAQFVTDWKGWDNQFHVPGLCKELSVVFGVLWDPPSLHCSILYSIFKFLFYLFVCFKDPESASYLAPEVVGFI